MTLLLIFLFAALSISFLCSILESVLMSTPISYISMREEEGYKPAQRFRQYKLDNSKPIAAILSLNTIANTIGAAGVGRQVEVAFGNEWFALVSAITTILILFFSEIVPKTIGTRYWRSLMGFATGAITVLIYILYPLVWLVEKFVNLITPKDSEAETSVSREEVAAMADVGEDEGVIEKKENIIIQNVIKLDDVKAFDVMTPRAVALIAPESMTLKAFFEDHSFSHFSRIPVYGNSMEEITGYILRSEVLSLLANDQFDTTLGSIRRDAVYFNEDLSLRQIWENLLKSKTQISIIIDEYGSFQGIITLEDIVETIFGLEILDESDEVGDLQQLARERWQERQKKYKSIQLPVPDSDTDASVAAATSASADTEGRQTE